MIITSFITIGSIIYVGLIGGSLMLVNSFIILWPCKVKGELKATGQIFCIHRLLPILIDTAIIMVKQSKKLRISMRKWHKTKGIPRI